MTTNKNILLVEDDLVDIMTIKRAIKQLEIQNELHNEVNGVEAIQYLKNTDELPGLIILDLNMPKMNGIEFLQHIKIDEKLKTIPVVVLTTSKDQQDKLNTFNLSIAGYMIKPVDYNQFKEMVKTIHHYWELSELPY